MANSTVALIGVRAGSKRVLNKNSRPFAGSNLLTLKIQCLLNVPGIDQVVVNSECPTLLAIAKNAGARTIVRDPHFATDQISASDYYRHIAENCDADTILSATVTTPLARPDSYQSGIDAYHELGNSGFDSVTSCCSVKEFLYQDGKALNYDPRNQVRSQDLPDIVALNYVYSIISRDRIIEYKNIVGRNPFFMVMPRVESIDIDTMEDFFIAETLFNELSRKRDRSVLAA